MIDFLRLSFISHAELVSASIVTQTLMVQKEKWTLKQVQGDEVGL